MTSQTDALAARATPRGLISDLQADLVQNRGNQKASTVVILFRVGSKLLDWRRRAPVLAPIYFCYRIGYTLFTEWLLGLELKLNTHVGEGLRLEHCMGLVVNQRCEIGSYVTLRHNTTLGEKRTPEGVLVAPILGDHADVGANAVIIGGITVGRYAVIGAGAVVTRDVADHTVVVGNPARPVQGARSATRDGDERSPA